MPTLSKLLERPEGVRKILLCQLRQIGDVILATPAVELLARRFPDAELHFLTEKKCAPILENNPHLKKIWVLDKKIQNNLWKDLAFAWRVAAERFDIILDFQQLPRIRWVLAFSPKAVKLSHTPPWYNRPLYTAWTAPPRAYAAAAKAAVLAPLGVLWSGEAPKIYLGEEELKATRQLLEKDGFDPGRPLLTVDATHRHPTRRWPTEHYARILALAWEQRPDFQALLLYGPGEEEEVRGLAAQLPPGSPAILPGRMLSLREMAAAISLAGLHLGNCSAPRHMAVAVGTPSLTILGATGPGWTFPAQEHAWLRLNLDCMPCNRNTCRDCRCLRDLTPEAALPELLLRLPEK